MFGQYLYPFNFTHHPAISVPCGLNKRGLPMGWQIVGPLGDDYRILVAARTFEMINPFPKLPQLSQQKPLQLQNAEVCNQDSIFGTQTIDVCRQNSEYIWMVT
ncbi:hypothetical protein BRE01_34710 [Brevibacillus reuszeri]|uniref:Amidase domain-containing protein n=1 Tax=Brevibacillus reuszeri TaxID=54915 RepID=A0A0K9YPZ5_9BACL|nr:hypothetical protein ADS79_17945 [Brevibacillus reuszeri]GED69769.1 hypothetical protein BRE01_34710 [Brevibacillus reuszeri]